MTLEPAPPAERSRTRPSWWLGPVAALVVAVLALPPLLQAGGDPSVLLRVGKYSASRDYVEAHLEDPVLTEDYGHDGQQFFVLATTFPSLTDAQGHVDKLRYRARRVLVPAVVSPLPDGPATVWGLLAANLVAVAAAAVAVGELAKRLGAPAALGLTVPVSPAMVESVQGSLADAPAFALALWGVVVWRRRPWVAAGLLLAAALARETTLVVAVACLLVAPSPRHRVAMAAPIAGFAAWMLVVAAWLPPTPGATSQNLVADAVAQLDLPFRGWVEVGLADPAVVFGALLLAGAVTAAWWLRDELPEVSLWLLADAVLLVTSAAVVVGRLQNFARVAPLAIPAAALALAAHRAGAARRSGASPRAAQPSS